MIVKKSEWQTINLFGDACTKHSSKIIRNVSHEEGFNNFKNEAYNKENTNHNYNSPNSFKIHWRSQAFGNFVGQIGQFIRRDNSDNRTDEGKKRGNNCRRIKWL